MLRNTFKGKGQQLPEYDLLLGYYRDIGDPLKPLCVSRNACCALDWRYQASVPMAFAWAAPKAGPNAGSKPSRAAP